MGAGAVQAAAGSWVASLSRQTVAASETPLRDRPLDKPEHIEQGRITTVHWSFAVEGADVPLQAWLCHASLCVALPAAQGSTPQFSGHSVTTDLRFRFWYPATQGASGSASVSRAQVIVDYED